MNMFIKRLFVATLLLLITIISSAENPTEILWLKAVSIMGTNQHWKPLQIHSRVNQYNRKGLLENSMEIFIEGEKAEDIAVKYEVVRLLENSTDITANHGRDLQKINQEAMGSDGFQLNFDYSKLKDISNIEIVKEPKVVLDETCKGFRFEMVGENKEKLDCVVWVSQSTAIPRSIEVKPLSKSVLPNGFNSEVFYSNSKTEWYPVKTIITMDLNLILIKRKFETIFSFSNYTSIIL